MKYLYVISLVDSTGSQVSWGIVATTMTAALTEARTRANVASDAEPMSQQRLHPVHYIVS
jgi:hypothetical protein